MNVLVTGGAGFIGSHLIDALVARGDDVVVLDNLKRGRVSYIEPHLRSGAVSFIEGDIRDEDSVACAVDGTGLVYHLAAQSNVMGAVQDMDYSFTTNVVGTYNVLKAAARAGVPRLIFSSSREVYGDPETLPVREDASLSAKNPYGASKLAGEAYCRVLQASTGLDCFVLRFSNVYGPRDRDRVIPTWLARAADGKDLEVYGGSQILDLIAVGQAVGALLSAATCANDGYPINVGSGAGTQILELARRIIALTNARSEVRILPARTIEVVRFVANVDRMRSILGVEPAQEPLGALAASVEAYATA
jgi:UDP-glucose 4-epimerase